jgi:hypothetical protein
MRNGMGGLLDGRGYERDALDAVKALMQQNIGRQ